MKVGLVGLGVAAKMMMPSLAIHPTVRIGGAADPRPDARERFTEEYGVKAYETAEQLFADPDIDAVYIAAPSHLHCSLTVAAAERGKHVIVEKPMALTLSECDLMIAAAERHGTVLIVGHTHSFNAPIAKMREIIRSGRIGDLSMINTWNYNDYLYRPRWPNELDTRLGGGIIYNQVPHQVDIVRLLGGGMVRSVRAMAWKLDPARPTEGSHLTYLEFENGSAASMVMSGHDHFDSDELHSWVGEMGDEKEPGRQGSARRRLADGDRNAELGVKASVAYGGPASRPYTADRATWHQQHCGILVASCLKADLRPTADGLALYGDAGYEAIALDPPRCLPDKLAVLDELYEGVAHKKNPVHDGRWGKATLEVCQAILTSARDRREIYLSHQVGVRD